MASRLIASGHKVRGLVRDEAKAETVAAYGIDAVIGTLDDAALLQAEARAADAVVNTASSDHRGAVETLIEALAGSGKPFIHSSGSSIIADLAMGEPSDRIFQEGEPITPLADKAARVAIDRLVLAAHGIVICNTMIYGHALGPPAQSVQVPALVRQAKTSGVARYIGRGLNRWSNAHIADVAALYPLAIARAPSGTFMYVESGEEALGEIVKAIAAKLRSRRGAIMVRRGSDCLLGPRHGGLFARLQQPRARQGRGGARLDAEASVDHKVDRR